MDDGQLLELAAKASGINVDCWDEDPFDPEYSHNHKPALRTADLPRWWWNPLLDDGDAFRLAVSLRIGVVHNDPRDNSAWVMADSGHFVRRAFQSFTATEEIEDESGRLAATRRAIVRAAANIGKAMP